MKNFKILLVVSIALLAANFALAQTWQQTSASTNISWSTIASSADGTKLVAAAYSGNGIWVSTNSGATWTVTSAPHTNDWIAIASSADGTRLAAADGYFGVIYTSADSGTTWTMNNVPNLGWHAIALSADGTKLVASATGGFIYTSADSGTTWISNSLPVTFAVWVASSADGIRLVTVANEGYIFTSTNTGTTWQSAIAALNASLCCVASSADGSKLVTGGGDVNCIFILTSTNSGATWNSNSVPDMNYMHWQSFASSADGNTLVAVAGFNLVSAYGEGVIFISTNSGATWIQADAPVRSWTCVASSADGSKLVGSASPGRLFVYFGGIYISQTTPTPWLGIVPLSDNLLLSWLMPSTNFVMQQSSDLSSWTDVTNAPVLNLTNLQNEVMLPMPAGSGFYRLKTP
jgi:photosystem II stability/assembly factor-like uncharacterized protein